MFFKSNPRTNNMVTILQKRYSNSLTINKNKKLEIYKFVSESAVRELRLLKCGSI